MNIQSHVSLNLLNTLRLPSKASLFAPISAQTNLPALMNDSRFFNPFILGGGSNILFVGDYEGVVLKTDIKGIDILSETDEGVVLEVGSGESWHSLVAFAVDHNWGGIENMALIPGTVGAAPVQNIAAYGQNFVDVFESLDAFDMTTGKSATFDAPSCKLAYRSSIFKTTFKNRYLITKVRIKLHKKHQLSTDYFMIHMSYDSLRSELRSFATAPYTIKDVYQAVIHIRTRKLPDPKLFPTCGSFFLNPTISRETYDELSSQIPELQSYPVEQLQYTALIDPSDAHVKIPAGRLIDELGWRGKTVGNCSVWDKHALVFTHNGDATGKEFLEFTNRIKNSVFESYGVSLESEIVVV